MVSNDAALEDVVMSSEFLEQLGKDGIHLSKRLALDPELLSGSRIALKDIGLFTEQPMAGVSRATEPASARSLDQKIVSGQKWRRVGARTNRSSRTKR
jgi:hypothetical protein